MKLERTKNAARNIVYGFILQIYQLLIPFILRTAIIYALGVPYLGLNGLFTSILKVLNLMELGVGSAMVYSMYQPIAQNDEQRICALLNLYKIYYRGIGFVVLVLGIAVIPGLPWLIEGEIPQDINIYILYFMNLTATVVSYWFFSYRNSLFLAHQRYDVISKVTCVTDTFKYAVQFLSIMVFRNYYGIAMALLFSQLLNNVLIALVSTRVYPQYRTEGTLSKQEVNSINGRIRDLITSKISAMVMYSSDTLVISAFLGLETLAIYQNYYFLMTAVSGVLVIFPRAIRAGVGNSIIVDSKKKLFSDFRVFMFALAWITGLCSCCFLCLYQPFIKLWVGEALLLEMSLVIMLVLLFFLSEFNRMLNMYKDAAGMWRVDWLRPLVAAATNITLNIIMVQRIGLYGVVISTIIAIAGVEIPWLIMNLFRVLFERENQWIFVGKFLSYFVVSAVACGVCYALCAKVHVSGIMQIVFCLIICFVFGNIVMLACYCKFPEFGQCVKLADRVMGQKITVLHKLASIV